MVLIAILPNVLSTEEFLFDRHPDQMATPAWWDLHYHSILEDDLLEGDEGDEGDEGAMRVIEWFEESREVADVLVHTNLSHTNRARALVLGCGLSSLPHVLVSSGRFEQVVGVDASAVVVEYLQKQSRVSKGVSYVWAKAAKLPFASGSVTAVFEEGLLDSLSCTWEARDGRDAVKAVLAEVWRVLQDNGWLLVVGFGGGIERLPHESPWEVETLMSQAGFPSYILRKASGC